MKVKLAIVALVVVIVVLGVAIMITHGNAVSEKQKDTQIILAESNKVVQTQTKLAEQVKVNETLTTNLVQRTEEVKATSNQLVATSAKLTETAATLTQTAATLAKTEADARAAALAAADVLAKTKAEDAAKLAATEAAAKQAAQAAAKASADALAKAEREKQAELAKRDTRINELVSNTEKLTQRMGVLTNSLNNLNILIAKTEKELELTKSDKEFLTKELKRLQIEKAELEKQMNDLAFLREQVRHLKEELSVAKRIEWIRKGIFGDSEKRGAQILNDGIKAFSTKTNAPGTSELNVELRKDGSITITPPAPPKKEGTVTLSPTNAPPKPPAPKK